ncbi:MAG TPA: thioesterase family protein [Mycobacteriales bacterium]|nr:thioesterase family protein [Mycobacteriales bacterium]
MTRAVWSAPVRYAECDQQGIVFHAHYLVWADESVLPWLASVGTPYAALLERGLDTRVVSTTLDWTASARYGDVVEVDAALHRLGRTSFTVAFDVRVGERQCCRVRTTYVVVDEQGRPTPVPEDLSEAWSAV